MKPRRMRLFSLLFCLVLVLCALPFAAMAADSYPLLQEYYQTNTKIWYTESANEQPVTHRHIESVTLGGTTVNYAYGGNPDSSNGVALSSIYPGVTNETVAGTATLTVTPKSGYYVTKVVIACCHRGSSAFNCDTWNHDCAFEKEFDMSTGMNVSISVASNNFGHSSREDEYFIIIETAATPDPVYVVYDPGEMSGNAAFSGEDWMPDSNTAYSIQYKYPTTDAQGNGLTPSHTVAAITNEALTAARTAGKEFSHWELVYYEGVTLDNEDKVVSMSDSISTAAAKNPADTISVPVHAELTAIWKDVEKIDLIVNKIWDDSDNQDGKRPSSIQLQLYANGTASGEPVSVAGSGSTWTYTFNELPFADENGKQINYTVKEINIPADYAADQPEYQFVDGVATITNSHAIEKISVSGSKTWIDHNDQDGLRPETITINLLANGQEIDSRTVSAADNWTWSFTGLNKYEDGVEIVYSIEEDAVPGYTSTIDGYNVTNTHETATVDVSGAKTWVDNDNAAGTRPESITVHLMKNGEKFDSISVTAGMDWKYSFTGLDKYADGVEIVYSVTEDPVTGYSSEIDGYNITNTVIPEPPSEPTTPEETDPPVIPPAETPQTGDNAALGLLCTLLAIGGIGIAGTLFFFIRKKRTT